MKTLIREQPLLMCSEMVLATLSGRKTMTRRVMLPQPKVPDEFQVWSNWGYEWALADKREEVNADLAVWFCDFGVPGQRLWVRETFLTNADFQFNPPLSKRSSPARPGAVDVYYRADGELSEQMPEVEYATNGKRRWAPAIHMPHWASRLMLEVTDIRIERVQDISEEDCLAEGIDDAYLVRNQISPPRRGAFQYLWDSLNFKRGAGWDVNPFCWVVSFKKLETDSQ